MNLISNHNHGETKGTQLLKARTHTSTDLSVVVEASYNAMAVINYVINKHILVEPLMSYYKQQEFLIRRISYLIMYPLSNIYPISIKECKNDIYPGL